MVGHPLRERLDADGLVVAELVELGLAAREVDQLAGVGDVAGAGDRDVVVDGVYLLDAVPLDQRRARPPVGREHDTRRRPHADGRAPALDGFAGVLDLVETSVRREDRDPAVVRLLLVVLHCRNRLHTVRCAYFR